LPTEDLILSLIEQYGWSIVFFGVMIQSAGIPLPAQTILIVSGFLVQQGHLKLGAVIVFATLGTVVGGPIGYWVGHEVGRPLALWWGRYVLITPNRLQRAEKFLERYGGVSLLLIRFVPGVKPYGALLAGINRMHWSTFLFYNAIGGGVWTTTMVLVGYFLGDLLLGE
jgi:membrane protein DedA with SNARE-associated domain